MIQGSLCTSYTITIIRNYRFYGIVVEGKRSVHDLRSLFCVSRVAHFRTRANTASDAMQGESRTGWLVACVLSVLIMIGGIAWLHGAADLSLLASSSSPLLVAFKDRLRSSLLPQPSSTTSRWRMPVETADGVLALSVLPDRLANRREQDADSVDEERFLGYLPHSGFHNQRISLQNAMVLACYLNRTLLLPPILAGWPISGRPYDALVRLSLLPSAKRDVRLRKTISKTRGQSS